MVDQKKVFRRGLEFQGNICKAAYRNGNIKSFQAIFFCFVFILDLRELVVFVLMMFE